MNSTTTHYKLALLILGCVILLLISPFCGLSLISPEVIWQHAHPDADVFWRLRLPRTLLAFLAGSGLAVSGMVFQALFRNPLATPFTLGVSSGAALGASIYFSVGSLLAFLGSAGSLIAALAGGFMSVGLVYFLTRARGGFSTPVMLLAGVIINFFLSSLVMFIQYMSDSNDSLRIMRWLMGSLSGLEVARLAELAFITLIGTFAIGRLAPEIDLLSAGETLAASRGVQVQTTKIRLFIIASTMVATIVSFTGPIGFVGMMVPHVCRLCFGWAHQRILPAVFFLGGCFLALCDLLSRLVLAPAEIPIGIITALIGGPFFLWTLFRATKTGLAY